MSETFKQLKINGQQVNVGSADRDGEGNIITSTYARQDGYYSTLGAGTAEQLISTVGVTDEEAYRFRSTAGNTSVSDGNAEIKMLKGNTKQFNQLISNGNFASTSRWQAYLHGTLSAVNNKAVLTFDGSLGRLRRSSAEPTTIAGHIYLATFCIGFSVNADVNILFDSKNLFVGNAQNTDIIPAGTVKRCAWIVTGKGYTSDFLVGPTEDNPSVYANGEMMTIENFMLFDLTAMGEANTTKDQFFLDYSKSYYSNNAGTLYNPSVSAIKSVGFNAFNPNTGYAHVIKGIDGQNENNGYRVAGTYNSLYIIEAPSENPTIDGTLLTPESFTDAAGNTINRILPLYDGYVYAINPGSDFIMNLVWSGSRDGDTAEDNPYTEFTRELPVAAYFPNDMKSAGEAYDELNKSKAITRIGSVDFGTLEWTAGTGTYSAIVTGIKQNTTNLLCSRFASDQLSLSGDVLTVTSSTPPVGVLYYELATYIEESIDPILNLTYTECDWGTEEFLSTNSGIIAELPVGNVTYYMNNLRDKLQNLNPLTPEELAECLAELG